jgi:hypothetical protein
MKIKELPSKVKLIGKKKRNKLAFPTWRSILIESTEKARQQSPEEFEPEFRNYEGVFKKLNLVESVIKTSDPVNLILFLSEADASYQAKLDFDTVFDHFRSISVRPNEFYAVFDLYKFRHAEVDIKIKELLGIKPEDFTLRAMAGWEPDNPLYHPLDNNHVLRWASIAYFMFTLRLFKWTSMQDQYRVRFRVGTAKSEIEEIQKANYVALEKLCFLFYDDTNDGSTKPIYHFDKWLVFDQGEFDFVKPSWLSSANRQSHLNTFLYLVNAYLLNIPIFYLLILDERCKFDRNKQVAAEMNQKINRISKIEAEIEEQQIADCLAKTIRNRIAEAMNLWDKRDHENKISIQSDIDAVKYAKTLGLLPIPEAVSTCIYKQIMDNGELE